ARAPAVGDADLAALDLEDAAGDVARRLAAQPGDERGDVRRVHRVEALLGPAHHVGEDALGEARARRGRDRVGGDPVARELDRLHERERRDPRLCRRVVALPDAALEPRPRARVHDPRGHALAGLRAVAPVRAGVARDAEVAAQVDAHDRVPLLDAAVHEHAVAQDAGVVDDGVEAAEGLERLLHERAGLLEVGDVAAVHDRPAAALLDRRDHLLRGARVAPLAGGAAAEVVHDDRGALARGSRSACARPRPRPAPVTITTRPSQIPMAPSDAGAPSPAPYALPGRPANPPACARIRAWTGTICGPSSRWPARAPSPRRPAASASATRPSRAASPGSRRASACGSSIAAAPATSSPPRAARCSSPPGAWV